MVGLFCCRRSFLKQTLVIIHPFILNLLNIEFLNMFYIVDVNECACKNQGQCRDSINSYSCDCPPNYSGPDCEKGKLSAHCYRQLLVSESFI